MTLVSWKEMKQESQLKIAGYFFTSMSARERLLIMLGPEAVAEITKKAQTTVASVADHKWTSLNEVVSIGEKWGMLPEQNTIPFMGGLEKKDKDYVLPTELTPAQIAEEAETFLRNLKKK